MALYEIAYQYVDPITGEQRTNYSHCHADSTEEVIDMLQRVPVDALVPNGKTYAFNDYDSIERIEL